MSGGIRNLWVIAVSALAATSALAQAPTDGGVAGTVVAAATGEPLAGAVVALESVTEGAMVVPSAGRSFLAHSLSAITDERGGYRFTGLPAGTYRLKVRQVGYHPATVEVELARAMPFRVSIGLTVNPIRLEPLDVLGLPSMPYGRTGNLSDDHVRENAQVVRRQAYVESDATVLTHADVVDAITLGETDLFRALQRLPSVTMRDDWTAGMWTRGAPWSQTRVYVDDLPLLNPVHATGLLAGVSPDAIGAATFLPGGRSASIAEGAAGALVLTTRGATTPGVHGLGELSVVSARTAFEWASPGGRTGVLVAARRSYADLATRLGELFGAAQGTYVPYAFQDLVARVDGDLGGGWGLEASGLLSRDGVNGGVPDLLRDTRGHWGNSLARVTLVMPPRHLRTRITIGTSRFVGDLDPLPPSVTADTSPVHARTHNAVTTWLAAAEVSPAGAARPPWSGGIQVTVQHLDYNGPYPRPYPEAVLPDTLVMSDSRSEMALWGEQRWSIGPHADAEVGARLIIRSTTPGNYLFESQLAPRAAARFSPGGGPVTLTAAYNRSWQTTQALAPAGPSVGPDLYVTDVWLLANDTIPAVRSDIVTLGSEIWLGHGWMGSAHAYARWSDGDVVPEPAPGPLTSQRPIMVAGANYARGLELSLRRLTGRWTASLSYALGASDFKARSAVDNLVWHYPGSADRRHALDATVMVKVWRGLRLGAAATALSGAPFTRIILGAAPCNLGTSCPPPDTTARQIEAPNAQRTASYAAFDLLADWSAGFHSVRVGAFVQLRNVLQRANAVTYTGSFDQCTAPDPPELVSAGSGTCDRFERGVGLLPLAGLRVEF